MQDKMFPEGWMIAAHGGICIITALLNFKMHNGYIYRLMKKACSKITLNQTIVSKCSQGY